MTKCNCYACQDGMDEDDFYDLLSEEEKKEFNAAEDDAIIEAKYEDDLDTVARCTCGAYSLDRNGNLRQTSDCCCGA